MLYSRAWLFIHSIYNSLHLLIPNPQSIPSPTPTSLLATSLSSMSVSLFLFLRWVHSYHILDSYFDMLRSHMSDTIWYLSFFFWLTSLSMRISSCIHAAANDIISFFLWLSSISLWDLLNSSFCTAKETTKKWKDDLWNGREYLQMIQSTRT